MHDRLLLRYRPSQGQASFGFSVFQSGQTHRSSLYLTPTGSCQRDLAFIVSTWQTHTHSGGRHESAWKQLIYRIIRELNLWRHSLGSFSLSQWTISKVLWLKTSPLFKHCPKSEPDLLYLFQITAGHFTTRLPAVCLTSALSIFARHTSNNTDPILIPEPNLYHVFWQQMPQFVDKKSTPLLMTCLNLD